MTVDIIFANTSSVLVMFWHDFGQERGKGAMDTMFPREAWYLVALYLLNLIK